MKILKIVIASVALVSLASYTFITVNEKENAIDQSLIKKLAIMHFAPKEINDDFSEKMFALYLKRLDYAKKFLLQSDVDGLKKAEHSIDDDINKGEFKFFDNSLELINKRIDEAKRIFPELLEKPFDFSADEAVETDADKLTFAKTKDELKDAWRKSLKYQVMTNMKETMDAQQKAKEKNDTTKIQSMEVLEAEARKKVLKSNSTYFKRLNEFDRADRLATYFNTITTIYDPHTEFFAPKDKANFDINMSGQLEGIGAQLQEKDGYIKVSSIVPGSASYRQGQLKAGDVILKVAQGEAEPVDVQEMKLDDAVVLIRGKKGTEVRLTVKKPDESTMVIAIIRDIVVFEESYAKSVILNGKKKIGYIDLPGFYADFNGTGGRSCSIDIKKELEKLKKENVDGIILDLRDNGGGSLNDVVDMTGYFIDKGPIVQVKYKAGNAMMLEDRDEKVIYNGPFTIMVNSGSASASEIMAAAIQDYHRGLIVGTSPTTYGKGTVQRVYDLDDYLTSATASLKPLGSAKITCQKFYRVNGTTTQLRGVTPDIILPDPYYLLDRGEKEQDYPLAWDEIAPAQYNALKSSFDVERMKSHSEERLKDNEGFKMLEEASKRLKKQKDSTEVSLNFNEFAAEQKRYKNENKKLEDYLEKEIKGIDPTSLKVDEVPASDTTKTKKNADWFKALKKDIYLSETLKIMEEMK